MARPRVLINCVADRYANRQRERIVEFSDSAIQEGGGPAGGLISFRRTAEGRLRVEVYRCDGPVDVIAPLSKPEPGDDPGDARRRVTVRNVGQLRRLMEQLPDDTPIGLRVPGLAADGSEDVFTGGLLYARISDAADHLPYQFRLHLAAEGAM